jgi:hypothetical protein
MFRGETMRTLSRFLALAAVGLMLTGCLSVGQIARRGTTVDEGIGALSNRAILINLVRASRGEPLYFLSVTQVQGTGTTDAHLGIPGFSEGPTLKGSGKDFSFGSGSTFLDNSLSTQVQMAAPYTKDFYNGIMSPLGLDDVNLLLHQGFPRELVYYLAIDHAKFTDVSDPTNSFIVYNDPGLGTGGRPPPTADSPVDLTVLPPNPKAAPDFYQFEYVMDLAMSAGFTTEVTPPPDCTEGDVPAAQQTEMHRKACNKPAPAQDVLGQTSNGAVQFILQPKADKAAGVRLCFERSMAVGLGLLALDLANAQTSPEKRPIYCGLEGERAGKQVVSIPPNHVYRIEISTRSIYGIFHYLGKMMGPNAEIPQLVDYRVRGEASPTGPILAINSSTSDCFTWTGYGGRQSCVPNGPAGETTRQIFTMLNTLVALKQAPGDLPIAQTVVVAP